MKNYPILILLLLLKNTIFAHCQIPCGIYNDALRIVEMKEDFHTIKKSIIKIKELSKSSDGFSHNQLTRWVITKDEHASNIQKIVSEYFLTQRIRETNPKYIEQTTLLQKLLVSAMKCKQNLNQDNVDKGLNIVASFSDVYFDSHGLEHLNKIEN